MNSIVIAGCAGFLGSHLTAYLLSAGYRVIGIDNLSCGSIDYLLKDQNLVFYHAPLEEFETSYSLFKHIQDKYKPIAIYDFAGYDYDNISSFARFSNYKNNLMTSSNIINACMDYGWKIIYGSSASVYGKINNPPFDEEMQTNPITPYDIAKNSIELDIINSSSRFGFNYNILRIDNLIGENFNTDPPKNSNIFQKFIKNVVNDKPIIIKGDGSQKISFLDVMFCLKPIFNLIDNSNDILLEDNTNQTFNMGGISVCTINDIANLILDIGKSKGYDKSYKIFESQNLDFTYDRYCNMSKAQKFLGFSDGTSLKHIVKKTFDWYTKSPPPPKSDKKVLYESEKYLPLYLKSDMNHEMVAEMKEIKTEFSKSFQNRTTTIYGTQS